MSLPARRELSRARSRYRRVGRVEAQACELMAQIGSKKRKRPVSGSAGRHGQRHGNLLNRKVGLNTGLRAAPVPEPEPEFEIRRAKSGDAAALSPLLAQLAHIKIDELAIARNLSALVKSGGGMVVADQGALVGCCGWAIVPTVQHGALGRVTILIVDADHRRRGVGSAMLQAATDALRQEGCTSIEVMSDIEIAHSNGFFRALKFEQTSYRFATKIGDPR
jgi:ribosomal protein S18 acetylase RimI-like enzyme